MYVNHALCPQNTSDRLPVTANRPLQWLILRARSRICSVVCSSQFHGAACGEPGCSAGIRSSRSPTAFICWKVYRLSGGTSGTPHARGGAPTAADSTPRSAGSPPQSASTAATVAS